MHTSQALFPLGIEPGIPRVCPWKELLATGAQTTWLNSFIFLLLIKTKVSLKKKKNVHNFQTLVQ